MKANGFQDTACQKVIDELIKCCRIWKAESLVCSGIDISKEIKDDKPSEKEANIKK
ncbi:hypothetical protein Phum_PHUM073180 [Pediculus humanus corporis]|uniref:Cx9C motif-containing protein 4, mitochondrial n=1 Tax=Pediculus humanus subsp. corporis TaxID=121224 RepID=E0VBV1_PEDHC|nr:uncharacterized protein Phum_PHUM073180 [Pediculus humanus corporis]EEB10857.1 hypothetical protein Phum_PHUM073180 [Pediculus humanus corporis]